MNRGEVRDQIAKQMQHRAGIFFAKTAKRAVGTARIVREDRLQMRRVLPRHVKLLRAKSGNSTMPTLPSHQGCLAIHSIRS